MPKRLPIALLAACAGALMTAVPAGAEVRWACKPGQSPNVCRESLRTTVFSPAGGSAVTDPGLARDPKVDCFYVYPTVSNQLGPNASKALDPEIKAILRYQAQRFSSQCRVFAPLYRQITVPALLAQGLITSPQARQTAYADVLEAWKAYLARDNQGRGFVLIGHSQGTGVLRRLIRAEIDPVPELRRRLVGAVLMGGNVTVREFSDRGGDFQDVPVCRRAGQAGCVWAYSSFGRDPANGARFGKPALRTDPISGLPGGPGFEIACTNPVAPASNSRGEAESLIPTASFPPLVGLTILQTYGGFPPTAPTPWLQPAERYSTRCERINGTHVLMVRPIGSARTLNPSPEPGWGLHIIDLNIAMGDIQRRVGEQIATYTRVARRSKPRVGLKLRYRRGRDGRGRRCAIPPLRATLTGADRRAVTRADFRSRRRLVKRDRRAPFAAKLRAKRLRGGRVNRIGLRATLGDGRSARVMKRVRVCA